MNSADDLSNVAVKELLERAYDVGVLETWELRDGRIVVELCTSRLAIEEDDAELVLRSLLEGFQQENGDFAVLIRRAKDRGLIRSAQKVGPGYRIEIAEASFTFEIAAARNFLRRLLQKDRKLE